MGTVVSKLCCQDEEDNSPMKKLGAKKNRQEPEIEIIDEADMTELKLLEKLEFDSFLDIGDSRRTNLKQKERVYLDRKANKMRKGAVGSDYLGDLVLKYH